MSLKWTIFILVGTATVFMAPLIFTLFIKTNQKIDFCPVSEDYLSESNCSDDAYIVAATIILLSNSFTLFVVVMTIHYHEKKQLKDRYPRMTAQNTWIGIAIITVVMFSAGLASAIKYSSEKANSKTYNSDCIGHFNYTCGFCPESTGEYYSCENNLLVRSDSPDEIYLVLAMCLLLINPLTFLLVLVIFKIIFTMFSQKTQNLEKEKSSEMTSLVTG